VPKQAEIFIARSHRASKDLRLIVLAFYAVTFGTMLYEHFSTQRTKAVLGKRLQSLRLHHEHSPQTAMLLNVALRYHLRQLSDRLRPSCESYIWVRAKFEHFL
jgi:hypothetical protein